MLLNEVTHKGLCRLTVAREGLAFYSAFEGLFCTCAPQGR